MAEKDNKGGESFAALFEAGQRNAPRRRTFNPGDELDVVVVQIGRDAVFVELDGIQQGFIDAKDVRNDAGELTVKPGSRVTARVVGTGGRQGAVHLMPVFVRPPVDEADSAPAMAGPAGPALQVGGRVKGTVAMVERYGVFLQIATPGGAAPARGRGMRGLIPTAELGVPRGADLHKQFPLGTELEAKVVDIDDRGRIRLSVVQLRADEERSAFEAFDTSKKGEKSAPTARFGTLGDLLAKKIK